jgi:Ser/Thr protein kinase RdoA (MazF antagonist)
MLRELIDFGKIDGGLERKYLRYVGEKSGSFEPGNPCLSHGDFDPSHIYSKGGKYQGIIDFGDIRCTSIYHDLAHFFVYARKDFPTLLAGYETVTDLGPNYLDRIRFVAIIFGLRKLWWTAKNIPERANKDHPAFGLFRSVLS